MRTFLSRTYDRFFWSWNGLSDSFRNEHSFRYWVWANIGSAALAFWLPLTHGERGLIICLGLMVMVVELLNTAIENTVDYISTERHPLAGRIKDAASAGVMLSAFIVAVAWGFALARLYL